MTWDDYFREVCDAVAKNSKCLSRKIGAVLVRDNVVICTGYNGPPRGVPHCKALHTPCKSCAGSGLLDGTQFASPCKVACFVCGGSGEVAVCPRRGKGYASGEGLHLCPAAHAERNALIHAARLGIKVKGATLYMNSQPPCKDCLIELINAGVKEVVCRGGKFYDLLSGWLIENSSITVRKFNDADGEDKE